MAEDRTPQYNHQIPLSYSRSPRRTPSEPPPGVDVFWGGLYAQGPGPRAVVCARMPNLAGWIQVRHKLHLGDDSAHP